MKAVVLLLMFATLATGCSSSSLSEGNAYRRMRMKEISSTLEVRALTPFVRQVAATNPSVAGVSVSSGMLESDWYWDKFWAVFTLSNGDWSFKLDYGEQGRFWLLFRYSEEAVISFHCVAESRSDFRVVSVVREDIIHLDPVTY